MTNLTAVIVVRRHLIPVGSPYTDVVGIQSPALYISLKLHAWPSSPEVPAWVQLVAEPSHARENGPVVIDGSADKKGSRPT